MVKKKPQTTKSINNRRARHDYALDDALLVGMELTGAETKSLRRGHGHIKGAYVTIKDNELWLVNATITGDSSIIIDEQDKTRSRKLLAKRKQIDSLIQQKQQGLTIVPLEVLTRGRYIKLRIAPGRGQKKYDKREKIKKRDQARQTNTELKQRR